MVLLVEDSMTLRAYAESALRAGGFEVVTAEDGRAALDLYRRLAPAVVVLDVHLPHLDGWEVLEEIRSDDPRVPVLMLTGSAPEESDRVRGLVSGADDYVVKPVGQAELRARVAALLRRAALAPAPEREASAEKAYSDPVLTVDFARRRAVIDNAELALTPTEFKLLAEFVRNPGEILDRRHLVQEVWQDYTGADGDQVKVYVGYLRRKLAEATDVELIETVRGFGYRYRAPR